MLIHLHSFFWNDALWKLYEFLTENTECMRCDICHKSGSLKISVPWTSKWRATGQHWPFQLVGCCPKLVKSIQFQKLISNIAWELPWRRFFLKCKTQIFLYPSGFWCHSFLWCPKMFPWIPLLHPAGKSEVMFWEIPKGSPHLVHSSVTAFLPIMLIVGVFILIRLNIF